MWQVLKQKYSLRVKRDDVMKLLRELNPRGCERRSRRRFTRRTYHSMGPNYMWHADGYDKLKPFGYYGLNVVQQTITQELSLNISSNVCETSVVPYVTITMTTTLERPATSMTNQRIEAWWSILRKGRSQFWMELFADLRDAGYFNGSHEHQCLLRFCFIDVIQKDLDECVRLWNSHRIRPSRTASCPGGVPNELYYLPHRFGSRDCGFEIEQAELDAVPETNLSIAPCGDQNMQEYLDFAMERNDLQKPENWETASELYMKLKEYAQL
ncbi:hypothetical protein F7725_003071 [Dissostichus mawsoni]|uniref:Integrase core domain-containing protein n=1 Tax=Dissostichus mawsoni TaxID=36200 RepID=A0A7J5YA01_DISMA|nr:hypothetical protein F7725_003071 [Dissostichus mawsoni]